MNGHIFTNMHINYFNEFGQNCSSGKDRICAERRQFLTQLGNSLMTGCSLRTWKNIGRRSLIQIRDVKNLNLFPKSLLYVCLSLHPPPDFPESCFCSSMEQKSRNTNFFFSKRDACSPAYPIILNYNTYLKGSPMKRSRLCSHFEILATL